MFFRAESAALPVSHSAAVSRNLLFETGSWGLVVLALALPFEVTQRPLFQSRAITVTNLKLLVYAMVALALATLIPRGASLVKALGTGVGTGSGHFLRHRLAMRLFAALLLACVLSSVASQDKLGGLKWTLDLLMGGLMWLAIPLWLADDTERKVRRLGIALVAGAVIAAGIGIAEVGLGMPFAQHLLWFKAKPTTVGPYLRLSGTFQYANIAALFFELALPFALARCIVALGGQRKWIRALGWLGAVDVLLAALLLTYSRGALVGLGAGAAAVALASRARLLARSPRVLRRWILILGADVALAVGIVVGSAPSVALLRATNESDQTWYNASYQVTSPLTMRTGEEVRVPVVVTNLGSLSWNADGQHPFRLSYHWLYPSGRVAIFNGLRTLLPSNVPPRHAARLFAYLLAPGKPGRYLLVWDMVQEKVTWLSAVNPNHWAQPVRISGPAMASLSLGADQGAPVPATLPTAPAAPDRGELWAAGVRMVLAHPLLGVGPGGYRLYYGEYARPRQRTWDERILANSLPVEIFADLGLLGGVIFWAFLAAALWSLIAGVRNGGIVGWWQLAVVGSMAAFLGHGLVDYMLDSDAIFVLFWVLCGLAAVVAAGSNTGRVPPVEA